MRRGLRDQYRARRRRALVACAALGVVGAAAIGAAPQAAATPAPAGIDAVDDPAATLPPILTPSRDGEPVPAPVAPVTPVATSGDRVAPRGGQELVGMFKITAGVCGADGVKSGSYFRMVNPGGAPDDGPYTNNSSSPCEDSTWTPLSPGTDGGLSTAGYQPHPDPAFTGVGDAAAKRLTAPTDFNGVKFSAATNETDPQTGEKVAVPSLVVTGTQLSGDLSAFAAAWNRQHFNQGSPKPDGSTPGATAGPTGTYSASTGEYTLEWSSQIQGGPFNNFTGVWHFEGTFSPASAGEGASPDTTATTGPDGSGSAPDGSSPSAVSGGGSSLPVTGGVAGLPALVVLATGLWSGRIRRSLDGR